MRSLLWNLYFLVQSFMFSKYVRLVLGPARETSSSDLIRSMIALGNWQTWSSSESCWNYGWFGKFIPYITFLLNWVSKSVGILKSLFIGRILTMMLTCLKIPLPIVDRAYWVIHTQLSLQLHTVGVACRELRYTWFIMSFTTVGGTNKFSLYK